MILSALTDVLSSQEMATKDKSCYPHIKKINLHLKPYIHSPESPSLKKIRPVLPLQYRQPNMNTQFFSYIYLPPRTVIGYVVLRSLPYILRSKHLAHLLLLCSEVWENTFVRQIYLCISISERKYMLKNRPTLVCAWKLIQKSLLCIYPSSHKTTQKLSAKNYFHQWCIKKRLILRLIKGLILKSSPMHV